MLWGDNEYEGPVNVAGEPHGKGKLTGLSHTVSPLTTIGEGNTYIGDFVNGAKTGKGIFTRVNGEKYEGDFLEDHRHGKGIFTWPDGRRYEGEFVKSILRGQGVFHYADGSRYEGQLTSPGRPNGSGKFIMANKDVYEGIFKFGKLEEGIIRYADGGEEVGKFQGYGAIIKNWPNGDRYEGEIIEGGARYGRGKLIINGEIQDGYFWEDKYIGVAPNETLLRHVQYYEEQMSYVEKYRHLLTKQYHSSLEVDIQNSVTIGSAIGDNEYKGSVDEIGRPHGKGTLVGKAHPRGSAITTTIGLGNSYIGDFVHGDRTGRGKLTFNNPSMAEWGVWGRFDYEGGVFQGKPHGKGVLRKFAADDSFIQYEGNFTYAENYFLNKEPVGYAIISHGKSNGSLTPYYEGQILERRPHGDGVLTTAGGDVYTGYFIKGEANGLVTVNYADGSTYSGEMRNGHYMNFGVHTLADGTKYEGHHFHGSRSGKGLLTHADGTKQDGYFLKDEYVGPEPTQELLDYLPITLAHLLPEKVSDNPVAQTGSSKKVYSSKLQELLGPINSMIGLGVVKDQIEKLVNFVDVAQRRKESGLAAPPMSLHFMFVGNPGTGKTSVARELGKILHILGLLEKGHVVEVKRKDLVGKYEGHTAIKTHDKVQEALGGILFVDEAYSLTARENSDVDFGEEALTTLLADMEDYRNKLVVIAAGYPKEMEKFIASNPGLKSRFSRQLDFVNYSGPELVEIYEKFAKDSDYVVDKAARRKLSEYFFMATVAPAEDFGNARVARNVFDSCLELHAARVVKNNLTSRADLSTITVADLPSLNLRA